jgi:hypothetical protein
MALWFVAFQGSTPIGGPIVGVVMEAFGARAGLGVGGVTALLAAVFGFAALRGIPITRAARRSRHAELSVVGEG